MNKVLICLGMHRSGTSLIANWLHSCGLNIGDRLLEGNSYNQNGYFEDKDFLELHEEVLQHHQVAPSGLCSSIDIQLNNYYQKKFEYLVKFKNALHQQWGWKEPRTCLFAQTYKQLLPGAKYIIIFRDYPYVVDSLSRRREKDLDRWYQHEIGRYSQIKCFWKYKQEKQALRNRINTDLEAWCLFNQRLLELANDVPSSNYFLADYQDLITNDNKMFDVLTSHWGFDLNFKPFNSIFDATLMNEQRPELAFNPELVQKAEGIKEKMLKLKQQKAIHTSLFPSS